jgi:hypothetical protein
MPLTKTDILVYAHWVGMKAPKVTGVPRKSALQNQNKR